MSKDQKFQIPEKGEMSPLISNINNCNQYYSNKANLDLIDFKDMKERDKNLGNSNFFENFMFASQAQIKVNSQIKNLNGWVFNKNEQIFNQNLHQYFNAPNPYFNNHIENQALFNSVYGNNFYPKLISQGNDYLSKNCKEEKDFKLEVSFKTNPTSTPINNYFNEKIYLESKKQHLNLNEEILRQNHAKSITNMTKNLNNTYQFNNNFSNYSKISSPFLQQTTFQKCNSSLSLENKDKTK